MDQQQIRLIRQQFDGVIKARNKSLESIHIDTVDINPFLLRLLGFTTPEQISRFIVDERIERSVVTSFGSRIQKIAANIGGKSTGVDGADIYKETEGKRYYLQLKAGPNTMNKNITTQINTLLSSATRRNQGSVALLGMTYGKRSRVSSIIQKYSQIDWKIGREFWEFISGDSNSAKEIFEIIGSLESEIENNQEKFAHRYEEVITRLAQELREKYGDGPDMWDRLFEDNM